MSAAAHRQPPPSQAPGVALASVTALNNAARAIEALADIVLAASKPAQDAPVAPPAAVASPAERRDERPHQPYADREREVIFSAQNVAERQAAELDMLLADVQACLRELTPRLRGDSAARVMGLRTRIVDFNNSRKREVAR